MCCLHAESWYKDKIYRASWQKCQVFFHLQIADISTKILFSSSCTIGCIDRTRTGGARRTWRHPCSSSRTRSGRTRRRWVRACPCNSPGIGRTRSGGIHHLGCSIQRGHAGATNHTTVKKPLFPFDSRKICQTMILNI